MNGLARDVEWITRLVGFDTSSGRSNLALIDTIEDYLSSLGIRCRRVSSPDGGKANLFAVIGPETPGGIVLSGHTDVVPVTGQDWSCDPWSVTRRDGRLYGRGTCDMKGFCGVVLSRAPEFLAARLERPLILAFSHDEEIGCLGAPGLIAALRSELPPPAAVIIGEPTLMRIVNGHKGSVQFRTAVIGVPAHSSETECGVSAVEIAARLIAHIADLRDARRRCASHASPFSPPYSSIVSNVVRGGVQQNVIAGECSFTWEARMLPHDDIETVVDAFDRYCRQLEAETRGIGPGARITTERITQVPALVPVAANPAVSLAQNLTGTAETRVVSYASEAGQFQQAGFPTVICGPGSIEQAHRADEFVSLEQVAECTAFIHKLVAQLSRARCT